MTEIEFEVSYYQQSLIRAPEQKCQRILLADSERPDETVRILKGPVNTIKVMLRRSVYLTILFFGTFMKTCANTVDSRYLELQGTLWNTSRYP